MSELLRSHQAMEYSMKSLRAFLKKHSQANQEKNGSKSPKTKDQSHASQSSSSSESSSQPEYLIDAPKTLLTKKQTQPLLNQELLRTTFDKLAYKIQDFNNTHVIKNINNFPSNNDSEWDYITANTHDLIYHGNKLQIYANTKIELNIPIIKIHTSAIQNTLQQISNNEIWQKLLKKDTTLLNNLNTIKQTIGDINKLLKQHSSKEHNKNNL